MNERYGILPKMTTVCDTNMTENDFALSSLFGFVDTLLGESGVQQMYDTWFSLDYLDEIDAESEPNLTQNVNIDITIEPTSIKSVENSQSRNDIVRHPVDSHNGKSWIRAPRIATANSGLSAQSPNNVNVQAGATRAGASRISERFTRPIMENLTRLYRFYNSITSENNKIMQSLPEMKFNISNPKAVDNRNPSVTSNNNTPKINSTANGFELIERLIKHNRNHIEQFRFLEQLNYAKAGAAEKISKLENQTRDEKVRGQAFTSSQIDPKSDNISVKYIDYIRSSEYPTVRLENAVRQTAHLQNTPSHRSININNTNISGNTGNDKNEAKQGARVVSNVKNNQSNTELSRDTAQSIGQEKVRDLTDKLTIAHKESEIPEQRLSADIANLSAKQIELPKVISDSDSSVGASDTVRKINTAGSDADDINIRFANKITSGNHISAGQLHPQLLNSRKINADKIKTSGIADFGGNIYERSAHGFVSAISPENSTYIYNEINKPFSVEYLTNTDDTGMSGSTKVISSDLTVGPNIVNNTYESTAPQSTSDNIANKSDSGELGHVVNEKVPVSISQRNDEKAPQNTLKREVYRIKSVTRNTSGNVQFPEGMSFNEYFNNPQYYMNYGAYSADGTGKSLIHNTDGAVAAGNKTNDILLSTEGGQNNIAQNSDADKIPHGGDIKDGGNLRSSSESSEDITNLTEQYTQNLQNNAVVNENIVPTDITYLRQDGDTNIDGGNVNSSSEDITKLTEQYTQNLQNSAAANTNNTPTDITYLRQDGDTNIDGGNVNSSSEDITNLTEQYTQNLQNNAVVNENIVPTDITYLHQDGDTNIDGDNVNSASEDITKLTEQYTQNLQNNAAANTNNTPTDITYLRQDGDTNIDGGNVNSSSEDITNLTEQYTQNLQNSVVTNENIAPTNITYLRQDGDTNIDGDNVNSSSEDITNLTEQYTQNLQNSVVTNENITPTDITYLRQDGDTNIDGGNVNSSSEDITNLTEQYTQNLQNSAAANNITPVDIAYLHNPETTQLAGTVTDVNNTDSTRNVNIAEDKSPAKNRLHAYRSLSDLKLGMNNTFFDNRSSRVLNNKMTALRNENISSVNNISLQNEPQYVANELNKHNSTVSPNDLGGYTAAVSMRYLQSEPNIVSELQNTNAADIVTKSIASDNNVERNNPAKASIMESETESSRTLNGTEKTSENQLRTVGQRGNTLIQNNAANENTSNDILENTHNSSVDMMRESEPARLIYLEPENPARESDTAKSPTHTFGKRQYIESEYVKSLPSWARSFLRDSFNAEYAQTSVEKAGLSNDQNLTKFNISGLNEGRLKSNKGTFEARATQMSDAAMGAASEARDDNLRFMYDKALPDSVEGNRLNSGAPHAFSAVQPNNRYRNPSHIARPKMIEWNAPLQNSGSAIPNPTAVYSHPVDLSLKSSEKLENTNAVQSRIDTSVRTKLSQSASQRGYSEAEIHRMAEKVYSIIEKRLKTERRRLGL